ncbi:TPA: hypothetical protein N0F65_003335 [Lagenidium giganteum]|uniref:PDZ domain-containing protein n=1 Tax=Lagenidium giganteum TaxID=4803 RepID=A0AAV2Z6T0_9STRA|nr:TPA: hypothetical protein N0F65_003335 [Lagenidium giganteum]
MAHEVPLLFASVLRYVPGDAVKTRFGPGTVLTSSDRKAHVEVRLACGATLYARRGCVMPEFRMLECGELPKGTRVVCAIDPTRPAFTHHGIVRSFQVREQVYDVALDESATKDQAVAPASATSFTKHQLRLAADTRVKTKFGLGDVTAFRADNDSYVIKLDFGGIAYVQANDVSPVDLRFLARVPRPLSSQEIFEELEGRVTMEEAEQLSAMAKKTYRSIQKLCEQHAEAISFISTNASYGNQYSQALTSLIDPSLSDATERIKLAGSSELVKLRQIAMNAKKKLETELLEGKDSSEFFAQAARVLSQLKNSSQVQGLSAKAAEEIEQAKQNMNMESMHGQRMAVAQVVKALETRLQAQTPKLNQLRGKLDLDNLQHELVRNLQQHEMELLRAQELIFQLEHLASEKLGVTSLRDLNPIQLVRKAEELLPQVSATAGSMAESGERYLAQMQQTTQGQALLKKAKEFVRSVENPEEFCQNVTKVIADVKFENLAAWGNTLTSNKQKRQEFVDRMKDHCLDFFVSVLPSIKVDTISGTEEGVAYSLSKLDLSNFKVKKERVKVRMGTVADEELLTVRATHLTALLKGFEWTFAQKYFPYLNGAGLADAELTGGMISLGFKAEKQVLNEKTGEFKPILVLNSIEIEIRQELKITVQGSWFSAIYNLLASLFAEVIRDYIARTMENKLLAHMINLLTTLNTQMDKYWSLVFQILDIRVEDLPTASPWRGAKEVDIQPNQLEVRFTERNDIPFSFSRGVLNKYVVVNRILDPEMVHASTLFPELLQVPIGASVLAINGLSCNKLTLGELKKVLEQHPLPLTIRFSLTAEDVSKNRQQRVLPRPQIVSVVFKQDGAFGLRLRNRPLAPYGAIVIGFADPGPDGKKCAAELSGKIQPGQILVKINDIDLRFMQLPQILEVLKDCKKRPATMHFASSPDGIVKLREWPPMIEMELSDEVSVDNRNYVVISAFSRVPSFAQKSHKVEKGDILLSMNDVSMTTPHQANFASIMETLRSLADEKKPMRAVFVKRDEFVTARALRQTAVTSDPSQADTEIVYETRREVEFPKAPLGILFGNWKDEAAYVRLFISSPGPAEKTGIIHVGQAILQICGQNVGMESTPATIEQMIQESAKGPGPYSISLRDLDLEREIMRP